MLGLIPKVLIEWVAGAYGDEKALEIKSRAGCHPDSEFRINEVYDDELWRRLVVAGLEALNCSADELEEGYARYFLLDAQKRWPRWFEMSQSARDFLERHPAVHNNFASGVRDPESRARITDKFRVEKRDDRLVTHYRSPNRHCHLYESLAREVLRLYGERAAIEHRRCVKRGDAECEIHIVWPTPAR